MVIWKASAPVIGVGAVTDRLMRAEVRTGQRARTTWCFWLRIDSSTITCSYTRARNLSCMHFMHFAHIQDLTVRPV